MKIIILCLLTLNIFAQNNSQAYTKAYWNELNKSKDMFLAQEAGRAADNKIPENIFTQIFNVEKFVGYKEIKLGKYQTKCSSKVKFKTALEGNNRANLFAICLKKVEKNSFLIYQGFSNSKSKRIEFILNSILIPKKHLHSWFKHFNIEEKYSKELIK